MRKPTMVALSGAAMLVATAAASTATAATIDFGTQSGDMASYTEDGFDFAPARLVSGNCVDEACLALNTNETTTLTFGGSPFTFESFSFNLLGRPSELTVTGSNGATAVFTTGEYGFNTYNTATLGTQFEDVTSLIFAATGTGNVRIDNVVLSSVDVAPVPLPAAGLMLLAGIGALAAVRRRQGA
jgi:hypothetical protein